mmetsp:Transcript_13669/g.24365  ORF Transcript_13669/g.24365 Transcript_13669/m.24365 type:complete len:117 (-) Transcript_13669:283-633(-)
MRRRTSICLQKQLLADSFVLTVNEIFFQVQREEMKWNWATRLDPSGFRLCYGGRSTVYRYHQRTPPNQQDWFAPRMRPSLLRFDHHMLELPQIQVGDPILSHYKLTQVSGCVLASI